MTHLTTWPADAPEVVIRATGDPTEIAAVLGGLGVAFQRWEPVPGLAADAGPDEVLAAYAEPVRRLTESEGFVLVDVAALHPGDDPDWPATAAAARGKFLAEHAHADDEVRFFAAGSGVFYLHIGDQVHAVLCEAGDLLTVPRGTTHWFDMGTRPSFTAIRFFHDPDGWVGEFTGSDIATRFPDFDTIVAGLAAGQAPAGQAAGAAP